MGGDLTFESAPGAGTAFFFTARFALDAQQDVPAPVAPSTLTEKPALIVDDSATTRDLLEMLLRSWSIPPVSVANAEEGLALLEWHNRAGSPDPFGLVIMDWMLPGMNGIDAAASIRARDETRALPLIVISAYAGKEEEARCAELGVNVFVRKPITASSLFDAIVESQGGRVHTERRGLDAPLNREFDGVRALLAEDNEANQMVAVELLARLGIELDVARNGREAVTMAQANPAKYAAILMDMQMPELDGLAATRVLRADRRFVSVPIIAMTANAMKADLDACLAAGMNDHVTKPIDRKALLATLRRWLPAASAAPGAAGVMQVPQPQPVPSSAAVASPAPLPGVAPALEGIDVTGTLQRLGIEQASLERMLLRFAEGLGPILEALRAAVVAGDSAEAAGHAHAIAGSAGNLGADALRAGSKALEQAAREGRTDLSALLGVVEDRAAVVSRSITALRQADSRVADAPDRPFDRAGAGAALERLAAALDDHDLSSANGALADLGTSGLPTWAADDLGRLRRSVDGYEFDEARGIASRLQTRMNGGNA
jgi:two-component system, sensor histidine kinase and response regulator